MTWDGKILVFQVDQLDSVSWDGQSHPAQIGNGLREESGGPRNSGEEIEECLLLRWSLGSTETDISISHSVVEDSLTYLWKLHSYVLMAWEEGLRRQ